MNGLEMLLGQYWIIRNENKEQYYQVKKELSDKNTLKFIQEVLGWKLIHTEQLIKIEKCPAHAKAFMGIQEFTEVRDYCFLCALLMFLEDKEESSQFLLSELIRYIEMVMTDYMEVDWTVYNQRKSLVRVLQYAEKMYMLKNYEGNVSNYSNEASSEVLYENTGVSRYFATNFSSSIKNMNDWKDFENENNNDQKIEKTSQTVFQDLITSPAMYWDDDNGKEAMYVKSKRQFIQREVMHYLKASLLVNSHNASIVYVDAQPVGDFHPRTNMISEIVLLVSQWIHEAAMDKRKMSLNADETIIISKERFQDILLKVKMEYQELWTKEYREIQNEKFVSIVKEYMKKWMMIDEKDEEIVIYPACVLTGGNYTKDVEEKIHE